MNPPRRPIRALTVVLVADISGVSTIAVIAAARVGRWATARTDAILLFGCVTVGLVAWVLAAVAVARYRRGGGARGCRRLIWIGLLVNSTGSLALAITAGALRGASGSATVAVLLAIAGAALSVGYLALIRERRPSL